MEYRDIRYEVKGTSAWIELARPEKRNALRLQTLAELNSALESIATNPEVRATVIKGSNGIFCSGYDLDPEAHENLGVGRFNALEDHTRLDGLRRQLLRIHAHPKPIICIVEGYCVAGGTDLLLCADITIASQGAQFGFPNVRALGISLFLPSWAEVIGLSRTSLLAMTGDLISGATAADWGMVSLAVKQEQLSEVASEFVERVSQLPLDMLLPVKASLRFSSSSRELPMQSAAAVQLDVLSHGTPTADEFWQGVRSGTIKQMLRRRDDVFKGSLVERYAQNAPKHA